MIDLTKNEQALEHNIRRAKEHNIILPTLEQMKDLQRFLKKSRKN